MLTPTIVATRFPLRGGTTRARFSAKPDKSPETPGKGPVRRIVAGVEETGDKRNFFVSADAVLEKGNEPTYGTTLVNKDGIQYEGCDPIDEWSWECDYASRMHVSRQHYGSSGYVLRVLWTWQKYVGGQAACAASLAGLWTRIGPAAFVGVLHACQNGPMERP